MRARRGKPRNRVASCLSGTSATTRGPIGGDFLLNEIETTYQARLFAYQKRRDFEYEYEKDSSVDLSSARSEDLRRYLMLIMDERGATEQFQPWSAEIGQVEKTILGGELKLENTRAAEHSVQVVGQAKAPQTSGTEHP
jgi:hypothetical protein